MNSTEEIEKQVLNDTYLQFVPDNGSETTIINQTLNIQIPRGPEVLRMNCGYIQIQFKHSFSVDTTYVEIKNNGVKDTDEYIGIINAATIFEHSFISSDNKNIWNETHAQIQARLQQFPKSHWYLTRNYASYLNIDDCSKNEGFLLHKLNTTEFTAGTDVKITYRLNIPIPDLFPCFQNCENFYSSALNSDIRLSLRLSNPDYYLCRIRADKTTHKVIDIQPLEVNNTIEVGNADSITLEVSTLSEDNYIKDFKMNIPAHIPTETERINLLNLINNQACHYTFKSWQIQSDAVNLQHKIAKTTTTNVNNLYGVAVLFTHYNSNVVFDKPYIKDIECSLSETYKLANKKVDTCATYEEDELMLKNLQLFTGQDGYKNINRLDKAILREYARTDPTTINESLGSYLQFFKASCGNMLGVSYDYFQSQIIYKCVNASSIAADLVNNYEQAHLIVAKLSSNILVYKNGALAIISPFSQELDLRNVMNNNIPENKNHGIGVGTLISALAQPAIGVVKSIGGAIGGKIRRMKDNKNTTYAYSVLGKDLYEKHQDIIEHNSTMSTNKFKSFINGIAQVEAMSRNNNNSHGVLSRHGNSEKTEENGTEKPEPITLDLQNIKPYYRSYEEEITDCNYKTMLLLDYKYGWNVKLHLSPWGIEMATENLTHGLGSWLRRKLRPIGHWFKQRLPQFKKSAINIAVLASNYATQILTGKLQLKDVPNSVKDEVLKRLSQRNLTGTELDDATNSALDMYHRIKRGEMKWSQVPSNLYNKLKEIEWNSKGNNTGNGLLVKHGFYAGINIKPSIPYSIRKRRVNLLLEKDPNLLRQKDLRKIYLYKYAKEHELNDSSNGKLHEYLAKLYRRPIIAAQPKPYKPRYNLMNDNPQFIVPELNEKNGYFSPAVANGVEENNNNQSLDGAQQVLMNRPTLAPNDIREINNVENGVLMRHGLEKKFNKKLKKWKKLKGKLSAEALGAIKDSIDKKYYKKYKKAKKHYKKNPTDENHGLLLATGLGLLIKKIIQAKKAKKLAKQGQKLMLDRIKWENEQKQQQQQQQEQQQ